MALTLFLVAAVLFIVAYIVYGGYQERVYELDSSRKTPAEELYDGIDYVPTHPMILLGHHFSSIAGAGPIVGPITAANLFGWLPAYLWIVIGSIFFGAVHDFGAIVGSIRHKALSIGELVNQYVGHRGKILFNLFAWLTLVLVVANFLELAAGSFAGDGVHCIGHHFWTFGLPLSFVHFVGYDYLLALCHRCALLWQQFCVGAVNVCDGCIYVAMDSHLLHFRGFSSSCMDSASAS